MALFGNRDKRDGTGGENRSDIRISTEGSRGQRGGEVALARKNPKAARRIATLGVAVALALIAAILLPHGVFRSTSGATSLAGLLDMMAHNVNDFFAVIAGTGTGGFFLMTICQYCAVTLAGIALGTCGAVYQATFRNPLASPSTLGVMGGCTLGSAVFLLFLSPTLVEGAFVSVTQVSEALAALTPWEYIWVVYGRMICGMLGGMLVIGTALFVSGRLGSGRASNVILIVIGQVFTLVISSFLDTLRYYYESTNQMERSDLLQMAQSSPFSQMVGWADVLCVLVPVALGVVLVMMFSSRLNAMALSDAESASMGVNVGRTRSVMVVICTLMTAVVVAFCGPIGFIGFVSPHIARRIVGPDLRYLVPASLCIGALFLIAAFFVIGQFDIELRQGLNLCTTILGFVAFIIVAYKSRGGEYGTWR